jgi:hypothetical protein
MTGAAVGVVVAGLVEPVVDWSAVGAVSDGAAVLAGAVIVTAVSEVAAGAASAPPAAVVSTKRTAVELRSRSRRIPDMQILRAKPVHFDHDNRMFWSNCLGIVA